MYILVCISCYTFISYDITWKSWQRRNREKSINGVRLNINNHNSAQQIIYICTIPAYPHILEFNNIIKLLYYYKGAL